MAQVSGLAVEVFLGEAVPNPNATQPSLFSNTATIPIVNNPPATGLLVPPQSPSGSVTGQSATYNYSVTETSTQIYTAALTSAARNQIGWSAVDGTNPPSPPGLNITETTPGGPGGGSLSGGTALNAPQTYTAVWMQANSYKWE
jgi:hypothetical protein